MDEDGELDDFATGPSGFETPPDANGIKTITNYITTPRGETVKVRLSQARGARKARGQRGVFFFQGSFWACCEVSAQIVKRVKVTKRTQRINKAIYARKDLPLFGVEAEDSASKAYTVKCVAPLGLASLFRLATSAL